MKTPPITISRLDLERLEHLLDSDAVRALPGSNMLHEELLRANVVEPEEIDSDIVTMNSKISFVDEQDNTTYELTLVYPHELKGAGTVSIFAPVGSALLGLSVGQSIEWQVPGGRQLRLHVVGVTDQPESQRKLTNDQEQANEHYEARSL